MSDKLNQTEETKFDWDAVKDACNQLECMRINYAHPDILSPLFYEASYDHNGRMVEVSLVNSFNASVGMNVITVDHLHELQRRFRQRDLSPQQIIFNRVRAKYNWS